MVGGGEGIWSSGLVSDIHILNEPHHDKTCLMSYANNKGADQPAHPGPRSLISVFIVRYLDSIIPILAKFKISRL